MLLSYKWLKSYLVGLPEPEKLAEVFSFHICELESFGKIKNGDYVFEINILPDRAHDLLCHRGVSRDLAGILGLKFEDTVFPKIAEKDTKLKIKIDTINCRRYMGRIVRNVKVGESPTWIKEYLEAMGQRSINNLVDATNIVMFDTGNPIHVFDLDKIHGGIVIRQAEKGEKMTTLDGKNIEFDESHMLITDEKGILAIAGIKGGKRAEVDVNTKNIIIEVANFDPTNVRKTSRAINLVTDAVKRFENDFSPEIADFAMSEISNFIKDSSPEAVFEKVVDVYPQKQETRKLYFSGEKISKILGVKIQETEIEKILNNFGYQYKKGQNVFEVIVPPERLDLNIEEDMAEEIGRAIGYDKIEKILPETRKEAKINEIFYKILWARHKLLADGYYEIMSYSFCNKGEVEVLASASDKSFLRTNLVDGLKESLRINQLNAPLLGIKEVKIFEIGTVFKKGKEEINVCFGDKKNFVEISLDKFLENQIMPEKFEDLLKSEKMISEPRFKMWSLYPFIVRDIAVWVEKESDKEVLEKILKENVTELCIRGPEMFDSFKKENKISYAYRMIFQSHEKTLTDEEVNEIMIKITKEIIEENKHWQIR